MSLAFNLVAVSLSVASLLVSALLVIRQITVARHANQVPVLVSLTEQFSTRDFYSAEKFILEELAQKHESSLGVGGLPEEIQLKVNKIIWSANMIGLLIVQEVLDEAVVVPLYGFRFRRLWQSLEPYIAVERQNRGDYFSAFFEDLVCRIDANWPPAAAYRLRLRRLSPEASKIVS